MKATPFIIERFAKFVMGGVPFESMKRIVADWNNTAMTGPQKTAGGAGGIRLIGLRPGRLAGQSGPGAGGGVVEEPFD